MSAHGGAPLPSVEQVRWRAVRAQQKADRAGRLAERHERRIEQIDREGPPPRFPNARAHHEQIAVFHRRAQRAHLAAVKVHSSHADQLARGLERPDRPPLLAAVADTLGASGVGVILLDSERTVAVRAASDVTADLALDFEDTLSEGPGHDATTGYRSIAAAGDALVARWPLYGPAIVGLGIQRVAATPLVSAVGEVGALVAFDAASERSIQDCAAVLFTRDHIEELTSLADAQPLIHQATGMVAAQRDCDIRDALALIRAHAFATGHPAQHIAAQIVNRHLRLD